MIKSEIMGWAVMAGDTILVKTVSDTDRAARINWLFTHGTLILAQHTDSDVDALWEKHKESGVEVVRVKITHDQAEGYG